MIYLFEINPDEQEAKDINKHRHGFGFPLTKRMFIDLSKIAAIEPDIDNDYIVGCNIYIQLLDKPIYLRFSYYKCFQIAFIHLLEAWHTFKSKQND